MCGRLAILLALLCYSTGYAAEPVRIPLSEVWAMDMPGTKNLRSLLTDKNIRYVEREPKRHLNVARTALLKKLPERDASKLFAVSGTGRAALALASEHLRDESRQGTEPLPSSDEISLTFFTYASAYHVRIEQVERQENVFRIKYRFVPSFTAESSVQLAFIPVGKLPIGHYPVELVQLPLEEKYLYKGFQLVSEEEAKRIVCQPYTFQVYERPAPDPGPAKDSTVIPLDQIWALNMPGTKDVRDLDVEQLPQSLGMLSIGPLGTVEQLMGKKEVGPGFVVPGMGREALVAAHKKLPFGEMPPNEILAGADVTVVYYSHGYSTRIVLHRVEWQGNTINIRYRYDDTGTPSLSSHFALIPLGRLPVGKYKVNVLPTWDNVVEESPAYYLEIVDDIPRVVCKSFEFSVKAVDDQ